MIENPRVIRNTSVPKPANGTPIINHSIEETTVPIIEMKLKRTPITDMNWSGYAE